MLILIVFSASLAGILLAVLFYFRWLFKHSDKTCDPNISMEGKVVIVTGANAGIGFHTAKLLASRGARVILACRNETRGTQAKNNIIAETGNDNVEYKHLNLSSLASVRKFAKEIEATEARVDVLVNNAGVHGFGDRYTEDNIVEGMQINFFAPFLLTLLLLPKLLESKGRIVNLSSILHFFGQVNLDRINKIGSYGDTEVYNNSKLCMILFTKELARKLQGTGVTVNAVHPGVTKTSIVSENASILNRLAFEIMCLLSSTAVEQGAESVVYLCIADECKEISGEYFDDFKTSCVMYKAKNEVIARNLWFFSERLVGYKYT